MDLTESGSEYYAEWIDKDPRITFIRIPFSAEWMIPLGEGATPQEGAMLYLGLGPDLIRTANDLSDFTVGLHLSGRLGYEFENNWLLAVEGGYMWSEVSDRGGPDVSLDGAFVIPTIGYRF